MRTTQTLLCCALTLSACVIDLDDALPSSYAFVDASEGGIVMSADGRVTLDIAPGALSDDTFIGIERVPPSEWPEAVEGNAMGDVYELVPDGLTFQVPAKLTMTFAHDVATDGAPVLRGMSLSSDGVLEALGDSTTEYYTDADEAVFSAEIEHFSQKFILGGTVELDTDIDERDSKEWAGSLFWDRATVRNRGKKVVGDPNNSELLRVHVMGVGKTPPFGTTKHTIGSLKPGGSRGIDPSPKWMCDDTPGRGSIGVMLNHTKVVVTPYHARTVSDSAIIWHNVTCIADEADESEATGTGGSDDGTDTGGDTDGETDTDGTTAAGDGAGDTGTGGESTTGVDFPPELEECSGQADYWECIECCGMPGYEEYQDVCEEAC